MSTTSQWIDIAGPDGSFQAYLAVPHVGKGPAIILLQEIFGVNEHIRAVADQYAADGYWWVPDLFWRAGAHIELGYDADGWKRAVELMQATDNRRPTPISPPPSPSCARSPEVTASWLRSATASAAGCRIRRPRLVSSMRPSPITAAASRTSWTLRTRSRRRCSCISAARTAIFRRKPCKRSPSASKTARRGNPYLPGRRARFQLHPPRQLPAARRRPGAWQFVDFPGGKPIRQPPQAGQLP